MGIAWLAAKPHFASSRSDSRYPPTVITPTPSLDMI